MLTNSVSFHSAVTKGDFKMPPIPGAANPRGKKYFTMSFVDFSGRRKSVNVPFFGDETTIPGVTLVQSIGNMSNAAMVASYTTVGAEVNPSHPAVEVFDETYSSVGTILRLTFQNSEGNIVGVDVPAPDASVLAVDRMTVNPANAQAAAAIGAVVAVLNYDDGVTPGDDYVFRNGYLTSHSVRSGRPAELPTISEPGAGDEPPDAPAT
jgi:hypothetical protein